MANIYASLLEQKKAFTPGGGGEGGFYTTKMFGRREVMCKRSLYTDL